MYCEACIIYENIGVYCIWMFRQRSDSNYELLGLYMSYSVFIRKCDNDVQKAMFEGRQDLYDKEL